MSTKYKYPQWRCNGVVDNENASLDLKSAPGEDQYIHIEKMVISIYQAAKSGGGKLRLQDTDGDNIYPIINVDGVKDISFDFGEEPGLQIGPNLGIQAVLYGAAGDQASVSIVANGHTSFGR